MRILALILLLSTLPFSLSFAQGVEADDHAVVLMYHRFDEGRYPSTSVRLEQFQAHLDYLAEENYTVWPLTQLAQALLENRPIPARTVVISVDDAYLSVYTVAFPLLKQRGWPMTVFVSTEATNLGRQDVMSWEQMREMQQHGVEFANHTVSHPHLPRRTEGEDTASWKARIRHEIEQAQQDLREGLGIEPPMLFAYPYGEYDATVAAIVKELGYTAFAQHSGAIGRNSDRLALPRYAMAENWAEMDRFILRVRSLPMPLKGFEPWEPRLGEENPPHLTLHLTEGGLSKRINCFLGDGTPLDVVERHSHSLTVLSPKPLAAGRSRYNCTAATGDGRFYWFSQQWINIP